jgi:hypothetical protein
LPDPHLSALLQDYGLCKQGPPTCTSRIRVAAGTWTEVRTAIQKNSTGGSLEITLADPFDTSDYEAEIDIPVGASVTILGQGAVLDAAGKGRFFSVQAGASLALDSLTLRNGSSFSQVNGKSIVSTDTVVVHMLCAGADSPHTNSCTLVER